MKVVIVNSSTLTKYGRWDAGFFTGMTDHQTGEEAIAKAQEAVKVAQKRLEAAIKRHYDNEARIQQMVDAGEIIPF